MTPQKALQDMTDSLVEEEANGNMIRPFNDDFVIAADKFNQLRDYQKEGVCWMWGLFVKERGGGILGVAC